MSAYFVGFLGASRVVPEMIRRVGHVRVFAASGSFVSAVLILYPAIPHPVAWAIGRHHRVFVLWGYVTAESWLNNGASNENRGQALSLYMVVQMIGLCGPRYAFVGRSIGLHPVCGDLCSGFDFLCADPVVHFTDTRV